MGLDFEMPNLEGQKIRLYKEQFIDLAVYLQLEGLTPQ